MAGFKFMQDRAGSQAAQTKPRKMPAAPKADAAPDPAAPLGQGGRFAALKQSIAAKGNVRDAGAVAASIGRKKYGKAGFQALAAKGRQAG